MQGTTGKRQSSLQDSITEDFIGERRLWTAVIVKAVEDWRDGSLRARREAQKFLFDDDEDFQRVCAAAGLEPDSFRVKLLKVGHRVEQTGPWIQPLAA